MAVERCILCFMGKYTHTHTHTYSECRHRNNLLNLSEAHTHTRTLGILQQDEGEVRRRHALGVDTFNRIAFRLPNAKCVRSRLCACRAFFLFLLLLFIYNIHYIYVCVCGRDFLSPNTLRAGLRGYLSCRSLRRRSI